MKESTYKSDKDPNFIMAAHMAATSLGEAIDWCAGLLKRCAADTSFRDLIYRCLDPDYEKKQAENYLASLKNSLDAIEHPETSTPEQRRNARINITMCYSWSIEWDKGAAMRDGIYTDPPPGLYDAYNFTRPSLIAEIPVGQNDLTPGMKPFDDNQ